MRFIKIVALLISISAVPALAGDGDTLGPVSDFEASWETCCNGDMAANSANCDRWAEAEAAKLLGSRAPSGEERDRARGEKAD